MHTVYAMIPTTSMTMLKPYLMDFKPELAHERLLIFKMYASCLPLLIVFKVLDYSSSSHQRAIVFEGSLKVKKRKNKMVMPYSVVSLNFDHKLRSL